MLCNRPRAQEFMRHYGLDVLVATSPVNVTYFTGYYWWGDSLFKPYMFSPGDTTDYPATYALFSADGQTALVVGSSTAINAADAWVDAFHLYGDDGFDRAIPPLAAADAPQPLAGHPPAVGQAAATLVQSFYHCSTAVEALRDALDRNGLAAGRIGLEMGHLSPAVREAIQQALPQAQIKDVTQLMRLVRMVKSEEELRRLRRAAEISEHALQKTLCEARAGQSLKDLARYYRMDLAAFDADLDHFAYSIKGLGLATEPVHTLDEDDIVFVDVGCIYQHYFSDTGLTFALKPLSAALTSRYERQQAAMAVGAEAMQPGMRASAVCLAMDKALNNAGPIVSNPHGHSFGLEIREYPIVVRDNGLQIQDDCVNLPSDLELEAGMVINLEIAILMPGVGSLHLEQTYLTTPQGGQRLIPQDRSRPLVPG